jgi:lipopolysaccharide transport system ATP-binding protein
MIKLKDVSVIFKVPHQKKATVYENLIDIVKPHSFSYEKLYALQNINLQVSEGETLGIIGPNGSGKSTLLKLVANVIRPDIGTVQVNGRITPFIELGGGFEPELTVGENIFLYGAILNIRKKELKENYYKILKFAELESFVDSKLKRLSSGMTMRLAFSIAVNVNPDILLIDEVLAVGDNDFQKKSFDKMKEFQNNGKTIMFVSHALGTVENFCTRAIYLNKGSIISEGTPHKVVLDYIDGDRGKVGGENK